MADSYSGTIDDKYGIAELFKLLIRNLLSLMMLNVVFLACCIPIVTIPAAIAGLNRSSWMLACDESQGLLKRFFKTFKAEFLRSIPLTLILAAGQAGALYGTWFYYNSHNSNFIMLVLTFVCLSLFVLLYLAQIYAMAMTAIADIPILKILKNSFILVFMYPGRAFGYGILSLAVLFTGLWFYPYSLPILVLILFALVNFIGVFCAAKNINKHILA